MGKANRIKKEKKIGVKKPNQQEQQKKMIDPILIEAYTRGRTIGEKQGKTSGYEQAIVMYHHWVEDIDKHVKGIGPKIKMDIEEYFATKMRETIDKNKNK